MEEEKKSVNADTLRVTNIVVNIIWYLGFLCLGYTLVFTIWIFSGDRIVSLDIISGWYSSLIYDLISTFAVLWIMFYLRLIIKNVRRGKPFKDFIHNKLKNIGIFLIVISLIHTAFQSLLEIIDPAIGFDVDFHFETVFIGIVFIIFSQILKAGFKLQQEQDLTI